MRDCDRPLSGRARPSSRDARSRGDAVSGSRAPTDLPQEIAQARPDAVWAWDGHGHSTDLRGRYSIIGEALRAALPSFTYTLNFTRLAPWRVINSSFFFFSVCSNFS